MKYLIVCAFCFCQFSLFTQTENESLTTTIENRVEKLDNALIEKDIRSLEKLLHDNLTLGHSNAWMETKSELLKHLRNGFIDYENIETIGVPEIFHQTEKLLTTRRNIHAKGVVDGNKFEVNLNVLEIWIYNQEKWQLLARQSVGQN